MEIISSLIGIISSLTSLGFSSYGLYSLGLDKGMLAPIPAVEEAVGQLISALG